MKKEGNEKACLTHTDNVLFYNPGNEKSQYYGQEI